MLVCKFLLLVSMVCLTYYYSKAYDDKDGIGVTISLVGLVAEFSTFIYLFSLEV